jgi:hypothetical protein
MHTGRKGLLGKVWGDEQLMGLSVLLVPTVFPKHAQSVLAGLSVLQQGMTVGAT